MNAFLVLDTVVSRCTHRPAPLPLHHTRLYIHRKLPQLVSHHILRDRHGVIHLPIVHLKRQPDKSGQNRRGARLRAHGGSVGALSWADDSEAVWNCQLCRCDARGIRNSSKGNGGGTLRDDVWSCAKEKGQPIATTKQETFEAGGRVVHLSRPTAGLVMPVLVASFGCAGCPRMQVRGGLGGSNSDGRLFGDYFASGSAAGGARTISARPGLLGRSRKHDYIFPR